MTYVNDYKTFSDLNFNKTISVAAMMDKASFQNRVHKTVLLRLQSQLIKSDFKFEIPLRLAHGL